MFYANNIPIMADDIEVLKELKHQLALKGINRFKTFRELPDHIQFNCPIHKNGQETTPSCGITTKDIKQGDRIVKAGTVHCFTCGYVASLEQMISDLFGHNDMGVYGYTWLLNNFITYSIEKRKDLNLDMGRNKSVQKEINKYVSEEELDSYRYIHPYMYERKLTDPIIELFDIGFDNNFKLKENSKPIPCITFPIHDENGNVLFIARRSVKSKFFHYPNNVVKPVYGLYQLNKLEQFPNEIYICESMLDCLAIWTHPNKYAVALNGLGTPNQFKQLNNLPTRKFILATDSDNAGMTARNKIKKALHNKILTQIILPVGKKDINECTYEEVENLKEIFI